MCIRDRGVGAHGQVRAVHVVVLVQRVTGPQAARQQPGVRGRALGGPAPPVQWGQADDGHGVDPAGGLRSSDPVHQHDHVYGANLAVRADAYLAVGGFPAVPHGEDQALVDRLQLSGYRLLRTAQVTVRTSGRLAARAPGGLADRLAMVEEACRTSHPGVGGSRAG